MNQTIVFRDDELIVRRDRQGNVVRFPKVGARLRLAHSNCDHLSIETTKEHWDGKLAVFQCTVRTPLGTFIGHGSANSTRDAKLGESLLELAETRSIARALRWAGFGVEYTGAEEVSGKAAKSKAADTGELDDFFDAVPGDTKTHKGPDKAP